MFDAYFDVLAPADAKFVPRPAWTSTGKMGMDKGLHPTDHTYIADVSVLKLIKCLVEAWDGEE